MRDKKIQSTEYWVKTLMRALKKAYIFPSIENFISEIFHESEDYAIGAPEIRKLAIQVWNEKEEE